MASTTTSNQRIGNVMSNPAFRGVLASNIMASIALGTSRFVFVWLVGELTEWNPATAILGILIGLPPLLLSAWAGSLADRVSARTLGVSLFAAATTLFTISALLLHADLMTVPVAMICALVTAVAPAMLMPLLQALVPRVVDESVLLQAVALQNLGMTGSTIGGIFLGGAVIQAFGLEAGLWLLAIAALAGIIIHQRTPLPTHTATGARKGAIRSAANIALRTEPLRSLLALPTVLGVVITASTLLLPEIARDVLGTKSLAASALNVAMSLGMITTSMIVATRWQPARRGRALALAAGSAMGTGLVALGLSRVYVLTLIICLCWGLTGGIAMTMLRTLLQTHTPPELMGRVMGLASTAQNGAFPIAAAVLFGLVSATSVPTAMVIIGVICSIGVWSIVGRRTVRDL